ncbi:MULTISPECIES: hypothetical protein [Rhizobium]|jgi:hypothetical protein|uniref:Uncharacterized protein n=1 Tax=Rhizobium altiplani TaxID=1864509 RepID=A0A109JVR5_9HYPH|nr:MULTISPECIES: hypothetical protein [Rhizobium]KWV55784.1 hypothetical protein AS026_36375 [Rhizobium altiplani]MBD9444855.1 hypothetical protein [Rhizobium sp. RHZ01]MBD9455519.1 hypothetical protein [Rhizobium sp. RHZ02]NMN70167.1 hypothetical protein [Rhizobium sp. 57MFTsu3.2]
MRTLAAVPDAPSVVLDAEPFGYVRKVYLDDEACWGLFDSDGDVIFVGDAAGDCHEYAAKEQIRIQIVH